jgi:ATP-dependent RNA helicase RhlE
MKFADLRLAEPILRALVSENYHTATAVQAQAIPLVLEGKDVLGVAQTGTGKTAAFALPTLQRLSTTPRLTMNSKGMRCLVLCPTRELATQIADGFRAYGKNLEFRMTTVFGGVNQNPQVDALRRGVDVVVATPGRLMDLMNQGHVNLRDVEVFVLDEADRMLDMGFINDIRKICSKLPNTRQSLLFSATMPTEIRRLADSLLRNPSTVQVSPIGSTVDLIEQSVYFVEKRNKSQLLAHLVNEMPMSRAIVFTRTKHGADKVVSSLHKAGIKADAIHGNKSQNARQRALDGFKRGKTPVLVATDIASRGIDVDDVTHVVNFDVTHEPESYVHRIGRTGRNGATGHAVSLCDPEERSNLRAIERLIKKQLTVRTDHPTYTAAVREPAMAGGGGESRHDDRSGGHGSGHGGHGANHGPARQPRRDGHRKGAVATASTPSTPRTFTPMGNGNNGHSPRPQNRPGGGARPRFASPGNRGSARRGH